MTLAEAGERAQAQLKAALPAFRQAVDLAVQRLDVAARALAQIGPERAGLSALYVEADSIYGLCEPAELPCLKDAAHGLCELIEAFLSGAPYNGVAVAVHVDALKALRHASPTDQVMIKAVLKGLAEVRRTAHP